MIIFKAQLDWIGWQGVLIVLDAGNFHAIVRDVPALVARGNSHLAEITKHVAIGNLEELASIQARS